MVKVMFLHPDLGIGGAERLVLDAALALQKKGHDVNFVTAHHDPDHCFAETKDGTIPVTVVGDWLPRHIFGRFFALCAYLRMVYAAFYIIFFREDLPDVVFCDLVSVCIPILKIRIPCVAFYCHHPDQLLSQPGSVLKSFYRKPLNYIEEWTTGKGDKIFVNSLYTRQIFYKTFKSLGHVETEVLYPSINTDFFDKTKTISLEEIIEKSLPDDSCVLLSINRYERKKNLELAIKSLAELRSIDKVQFERSYLIVAGGYDKRVDENVEYHAELTSLADELRVAEKVIFLRSLSDVGKVSVLQHCDVLLYTPANEHFGIVPLEAMYIGKPVIAHNSGGPKESVIDGETGFLANSEKEFAERLASLVSNSMTRETMGRAGKRRFDTTFSFQAFSENLNESIVKMMDKKTL